MKVAEQAEAQLLPVKAENIIRLPLGLFGFEGIKEYVLLANPNAAPFLWLQMLQDPSLAFLVVPPAAVLPGYQPEVAAEDVAYLELRDPQDAWVLNIVTLRAAAPGTVNLRGPVVINRRTFLGKQVIPTNAGEFDLHYPLPGATNS